MFDRRFKILSLDGGGIRGVMSILILKKIEAYLDSIYGKQQSLSEHFNLIAGTSTGAIIAALICEGKRMDEIYDLYIELIPKIFRKKTFFHLLGTKYDSLLLEREASKIWGNKTLSDLSNNLLVPAISLANPKVDIFSTLHTSNEKIAKVVCASASAPSYFSPSTFKSNLYGYIDGGLAANNPALLALLTYLEFEDDNMYKNYKSPLPHLVNNSIIVSIGTGFYPELNYNPKKLTNQMFGGMLFWIKPSIDILFENQSYLVDFQIKKLMKSFNNKESYLRINPILRENVKLDDYKKIDLLRQYVKDEELEYQDFIKRYFS